VNGVQLADFGEDFFTWDPVFNVAPNRPERRWGTDRLVSLLIRVFHDYRTAHDSVQRVGVMDLSREHGGPFGKQYGGLGHASHQNGLDADVLYPRVDGLERRAFKPALVDEALAQDLVDRFVAAGADKIFVGPHLHLHGPRNVVIPLVHHDDHMHVRVHNTITRP
jgi:murein endopeptidase